MDKKIPKVNSQVQRANEVRNIIIIALEMEFESTIQKYVGSLNPSELAAIRSITNEEKVVLGGIVKKLKTIGLLAPIIGQSGGATLPIQLPKQGESAYLPIQLPKHGEPITPIPPSDPGTDPERRDAEVADRIRRTMGEAIRNGMDKAIFTYRRELKERELQVLRSINQYELNVLGTVNQKLTSISYLPIQLP